MMSPAQQGEILEDGAAAVCPVDDVMDIAPGGGNGASRMGAVPVPGHDRSAERRRNGPGAAARAEDRSPVDDDRSEAGITGDPASHFGGHRAGGLQLTEIGDLSPQ